MYVETWKAIVSGKCGVRTVIDQSIHLSARLICPHCDKREDVLTRKFSLEGPTLLPEITGWLGNDLAKVRDCEKCGVLSAIPRANTQVLRDELQEKITEGWVKEQTTLLSQPSSQKELA